MKFIQYYDFTDKNIYYGILKNDKIYKVDGDIFENYKESDAFTILDNIKVLPPSIPSKIVCVGLNYKDHAEEMKMELPDEPIIFLKPNSSIIGDREHIIIPEQSKKVEYEAELAIIIKKECKNASLKMAKDYIFGYTCANDVTARDLQKKDGQWTRAKSFDTFCPIGPLMETDVDPTHLEIKLFVNNELKQNSNTKNMIFDVYYLVAFISSIMTLYPGDVILTGTPPGVGPLNAGDEIKLYIEGIGELTNTVK
jgi:2-keto-4-pentenoate hydratase/2-oxohepta-3-ene-1,7-dioic acid hydratase in catechol pathway